MTDHHGNPLTTDPALSAEQWLDYGLARGWCLTSYCSISALGPITADEEAALNSGDDPWILVARLL